MRRYLVVFFIFFVYFFLGKVDISIAQQSVATEITAEKMTARQADTRVTFHGNVYVDRPDIKIWADSLTVYFQESGKKNAAAQQTSLPVASESREIERIVAAGSVRLRHKVYTGTCGLATYTASAAILIMQQDPVLSDGENSITGKEIRLYLDESRTEVVSDSDNPVSATFFTQSDALMDNIVPK